MASKAHADGKVNIFKRIGKFFVDCKSELKKVVWPTIGSTFKDTWVVLSSIFISAVFVGALDYLLTMGFGTIMHIAN